MSTIEQPLEVGIIIPDYADDLIEQWAKEAKLWCVLYHGYNETARRTFKFDKPLEPIIGFRAKGLAVFDIVEMHFEYDNFKVEGMPDWCYPVTYSDVGYNHHYAGDKLNFTVRFIFNG